MRSVFVNVICRQRAHQPTDLPLEALLDVELLEEAVEVGVRPEEDVQPRLDPVPVLGLIDK